jgi:hypothetical protein
LTVRSSWIESAPKPMRSENAPQRLTAWRIRTSMCREKIHSLRCRASSDSGTPAETAAVPRENDLLRWGWTASSPRSPVSPTLRTAHRAVAMTSKFESFHLGRSDTNFHVREWIQQLQAACLRPHGWRRQSGQGQSSLQRTIILPGARYRLRQSA